MQQKDHTLRTNINRAKTFPSKQEKLNGTYSCLWVCGEDLGSAPRCQVHLLGMSGLIISIVSSFLPDRCGDTVGLTFDGGLISVNNKITVIRYLSPPPNIIIILRYETRKIPQLA